MLSNRVVSDRIITLLFLDMTFLSLGFECTGHSLSYAPSPQFQDGLSGGLRLVSIGSKRLARWSTYFGGNRQFALRILE